MLCQFDEARVILERFHPGFGAQPDHAVGAFMDALIQGGVMKLVDGGEQRRCYTYIDDAIECVYRIVENPGGVCDRQIFNIGSPHNEVSIRQLAEIMREIYAGKFRDLEKPLPESARSSELPVGVSNPCEKSVQCFSITGTVVGVVEEPSASGET